MVRLFRSNPARAGEAGRGSDFERYDNLPRLSLRPPCPARSALPTSSTGPYGGPPVALFPLLAPSLSAPTYRPADGPHTRASGLIEDGTWDHPQRRAPSRATRRRGKGRLSLRPVHHDPLARRVGGAPCAPLYGALVGAVRGRSRECGSDTPFLILSAMGFKRMEHAGGDRQHAGRSHRRAVAWQGRSDGCQVGHRRGFSSLVRVGRRGRLSFLTTFPPFGRVFRLAGRSPIGACPSLL